MFENWDLAQNNWQTSHTILATLIYTPYLMPNLSVHTDWAKAHFYRLLCNFLTKHLVFLGPQGQLLWGNSGSMAFRPVLKLWRETTWNSHPLFLRYCSKMPRMLSYIGIIRYIPHIFTISEHVFQPWPISLRQLAMLPEFQESSSLIRMQAQFDPAGKTQMNPNDSKLLQVVISPWSWKSSSILWRSTSLPNLQSGPTVPSGSVKSWSLEWWLSLTLLDFLCCSFIGPGRFRRNSQWVSINRGTGYPQIIH